MATGTLVNERIEDGQRLLKQLALKGVDVTAACWVREGEEDRWYLYIASKIADEEGQSSAYNKVNAALDSIKAYGVSFFDIKMIGSKHAIALDVLEFQKRRPMPVPTRWLASRLGDMSIEEAFLYPPVKPEEVWLRLPFKVIYQRQEQAPHWMATTKREPIQRGIAAKGALAYSTALRGEERPEDASFAIVSVLLEIPPNLDQANLDQPDFQGMLIQQAREIADELFRAKHPEAIIKHEQVQGFATYNN